ncbi:MAG: type II toxin-antitoxin system VapC family toxin [Pseudomonadota bacterium]|nr:type II toxin-antitoxin system VapC family toxin [Pseudomonadota bacterium]MDP1906507.1 type II toxin-antitoxin system VapC family toxin [Pseudomonadota bacterium]MDP2351198.1 type II toxin-antitoxin system VapC family toxin [Pseudomonadota bacterium]
MIVLDTHIWVRWLDPEADPLPASLIEKIESAESLAVSAITCWEVAWLHRRERIVLKLPLNAWMDQALQGSEVVCLPIERRIANRAALLPEHHRDPADRLIMATALEYGAQLVSLDERFRDYSELAGNLIQR